MSEITILDGGIGQEITKRSGKEPKPLWSIAVMMEQPEIVEAIHEEFIDAGADVITINAYTSSPERLERDGLLDQFESLQRQAVAIAQTARENSGKSVEIAGCLPPLVASYRADVAQDFETSLHSYRQIVELQADGVDLFLCETMASITEAKAAATAALESSKPVWLSFTLNDDDSSTLRSGEPLAEALMEIDGLGIDAALLNCSRPEAISAAWQELAKANGPIGAYANGFTSIAALDPGGTVANLEARRDLDENTYADFVDQWIEGGASIVGGCCEVGPSHIAEIARRLEQ